MVELLLPYGACSAALPQVAICFSIVFRACSILASSRFLSTSLHVACIQGFYEVYSGEERSFKVVRLAPGVRYTFRIMVSGQWLRCLWRLLVLRLLSAVHMPSCVYTIAMVCTMWLPVTCPGSVPFDMLVTITGFQPPGPQPLEPLQRILHPGISAIGARPPHPDWLL